MEQDLGGKPQPICQRVELRSYYYDVPTDNARHGSTNRCPPLCALIASQG